jgi:hypothetical protein
MFFIIFINTIDNNSYLIKNKNWNTFKQILQPSAGSEVKLPTEDQGCGNILIDWAYCSCYSSDI